MTLRPSGRCAANTVGKFYTPSDAAERGCSWSKPHATAVCLRRRPAALAETQRSLAPERMSMSTLRFFKITSKVSVGRGAAAMWPSSRFCRKILPFVVVAPPDDLLSY